MSDKQSLKKGGNYMEGTCSDEKKAIWEVVGDRVVEDLKENEEIVLRWFGLNFGYKYQ